MQLIANGEKRTSFSARVFSPLAFPLAVHRFEIGSMAMVKSSRGFVVAALVVAALAARDMPAVADNVGPPITVKYSDVDPLTAQGANVLYRRIRTAAVSICSPLEHGDLSSKQNADACVQILVKQAVSSVGTQALAAVYAAKYRSTAPATRTAGR